MSALAYCRHFAELLSHYLDHTAVYTDGSFLQGSTGSASVYNSEIFSYRLHGFNSVFTAELYALYRARLFIRRQLRRNHLVCTDSLSALQCLSGHSPDHPVVAEIQLKYPACAPWDSLVVCWVRGHCGLPGSEAADAVAKSAAMRGPLVSDRALDTDVCTCLRRAVLFSWQAEWDSSLGSKLHVVKPSLQERQSSFRALRKVEVTLTRHRIGRTLLTHGHLLRGEPAPVRARCGVTYLGLTSLRRSSPYLSP
jgi:ribonuclease HI